MNQNINNEGERAAQEYVDTTLRSSHYNQTQRIEDATDANSRKLSTLQKIILTSIICIIATYLGTGYVIYKHGSVLFSGDSIEGLRDQIKQAERERYWKLFYRALSEAQLGKFDLMNESLNKIVLTDAIMDKNRQDRSMLKAIQFGNEVFITGLQARFILAENPETIEALNRMITAQVHDVDAWNNFLKENDQKNLDNSALRTSN